MSNSSAMRSRQSLESTLTHQSLDDAASFVESIAPLPEPVLPDLDLPQSDLDLTTTYHSIMQEVVKVTEAEPEYVPILLDLARTRVPRCRVES